MRNLGILLLFCLILGWNCDPSFDCTEQDTLPQFEDLVMVDSASAFVGLKIADFTFQSLETNDQFIINSDSTYEDMKQRTLFVNDPCDDCTFPDIDFSTHTLIGRFIFVQCDESVGAKFVDDGDGTFTYYVKVVNPSQCNFNSCPIPVFNWLLVPKIDDNTTVDFVQGSFSYNCDC